MRAAILISASSVVELSCLCQAYHRMAQAESKTMEGSPAKKGMDTCLAQVVQNHKEVGAAEGCHRIKVLLSGEQLKRPNLRPEASWCVEATNIA